ncbi:MAG: putative monovalent cation/H+ antiporter subunit A [Chthoniobacterales bacterium]|nr:putative monovalent cation/H+ antiporter subunit A [Chthoniobacterales bacterium]
MAASLFIVFLASAISPLLVYFLRTRASYFLALVPLSIFVLYLHYLQRLHDGSPLLETIHWIQSFGVHLQFRLDGLALLFLLLIAGIGTLIVLYAGSYLAGHPHLGRFYAILFLFMGAMLGLVASENLIALFVFWELTSLSSYLLVGFDYRKKEARAAALQALLVTFTGGQALLVAFLILASLTDSFSFTQILEKKIQIQQNPSYIILVLLVLTGAFTKSAQTPFHFWLPGAMAAPTPVSAYLHSATMVTAGVFLLARLTPLLGGTHLWAWSLTSFGLLTMLTGSILAIGQTDLKRLLAYTTVAALGTMTMLLGLGTPLAAKAAIAFLLVHSLYKGALFMVAGAVDHETHTRDVRDLGGLIRHMPITAIASGLAALAMCGVPPVLGFISKELIYEAKLEFGQIGWFFAILGVIANALVVAVALIVGIRPFLGFPLHTPKHPHEAPFPLWFGPLILALLGLLFGIVPPLVEQTIIKPAVVAVVGDTIKVKLSLWHGFTPMLVLSFVTLLLGFCFFRMREKFRLARETLTPLRYYGPESLYSCIINHWLPSIASLQTRILQHGYLRYYVLSIIAAAALAVAAGLSRISLPGTWFTWRSFEWWEVLLCAAIFLAGFAAILTSGRITSVVLLGIIGYTISLIFALYGAPDLALTQFLVETLTLILLVLVLYRLPKAKSLSSKASRLRDALLSLAFGFAITLLVLKSLYIPHDTKLPDFFVQNSPIAQGRNVVNVILVDFRALDTLGEITVLGISAVGVWAVLSFIRKKSSSASASQKNSSPASFEQ